MKLTLTDRGLILLTIPPAPFERMKPPQPKFEPITGDIDPLNPFQRLESDSLTGAYVTRDDTDIEILVEIEGDSVSDVCLGNAFTLRGEYVDLSPEESNRILEEFINWIRARPDPDR